MTGCDSLLVSHLQKYPIIKKFLDYITFSILMKEVCLDKDLNLSTPQNKKRFSGSSLGLIFALIVLIGNGIHPIINNMRPSEFNSIIFVLQMSLWEFIGALFIRLLQKKKNRKLTASNTTTESTICFSHSHLVFRMILIGLMFSIATYGYVEGLSQAGSISGSIALKISPIYAILIGTIFLGEKLNYKQILLTFFMLFGIYYLGTQGTFQLEEFSIGFAILLVVPLLWTIAHALTKPLLENKIITPIEVIIIRTFIISLSMFIVSITIFGFNEVIFSFINSQFLFFSSMMGITYLFMHFSWYSSISIIDLSYASALVTPSPAITTIIALLLNQEIFHPFQLFGMIILFSGLYGMIFVNKKQEKVREKT